MNETEFVQKRQQNWNRLAELCDQADATLKNLQGPSMQEFIDLYRSASTDLAIIRGQAYNERLAVTLNQLVGRAYGILYTTPQKPLLSVIQTGLELGAQTMRKRQAFMWIALAITILSGFATSSMMVTRPDLRAQLVSPDEEMLFEHWREGEFESRSDRQNANMWALYASNNPRVSIIQIAISAGSFGVGGLYMGMNLGRQIGALSIDMASVGKLGFFYASIVPHGASELSGAIVSMGTGLFLGWAMISPGRRSRTEALREAGKDAFILTVKSVSMMFIAAPFEAYFSFDPHVASPSKVVVGTLVFTGWCLYWKFYARTPAEGDGGRLARPARGAGGI